MRVEICSYDPDARDNTNVRFFTEDGVCQESVWFTKDKWAALKAALSSGKPGESGEDCICTEVGITCRSVSGVNGVEKVTIGIEVNKNCPKHGQYFIEKLPMMEPVAPALPSTGEPCKECGGIGFVYGGSNPDAPTAQVTCPVCHSTGRKE